MAYAFVQSLGITIPESKTVESYSSDLDDFFGAYDRFIVKPVSAQGGKGLTLNITTKEQLEEAVNNATQFSPKVLVQRQFVGEEVRFTTIDGVVTSALLRQKPMVIGDGYSTVSQLIVAENQSRRALTESVVTYPMLDEKLVKAELLHIQTVPAEGERVELGLGTMIRNGASMYNIIDSIHASYIERIEKIARTFGRGFAAIDMMIADVNAAATDDNYIFLEMNSDPALVLYYSCRDGKNIDIVEQHVGPLFLRALEGELRD